MGKDIVALGERLEVGEVPAKMHATVIRKEREGDPLGAMLSEEVETPRIGPRDVLVRVMAAGVNFNGVWASRGQPVSVTEITGDPFHIAGSDASGVVWRVGEAVSSCRPGDHVVLHCNQHCGDCPECNGLDPMACRHQKIWGYETNYGSFAQFTKVQPHQVLPKPKHLSWFEAASYGLTLFTAYRMLVDQAHIKPGEVVLVWGAAGGLGIFALQLCRLLGATAIAVVSSREKGELCVSMGAAGYIDRREFDYAYRPGEGDEQERHRVSETRRMGRAVRALAGGRDPDVVFEHVGSETFAASCLLAARFGRIVTCGATTGYKLTFDVRHVWMRQKRIIGSHFANAYQAHRANELVASRRVTPVVSRVFPFGEAAAAHRLMLDNEHSGKLVVSVDAPG